MKRTAEKVLAIISAVFTGISVLLSFMFLSAFKTFNSDEVLRQEFEKELLSNQGFSAEETDLFMTAVDFIEGFSWFIIGILLISLITTIVGIIFIWNNKKPKLAGAMFIIGGLFALFLSPTSILLYIAGILCFTRKLPTKTENDYVDEGHDGMMRPL